MYISTRVWFKKVTSSKNPPLKSTTEHNVYCVAACQSARAADNMLPQIFGDFLLLLLYQDTAAAAAVACCKVCSVAGKRAMNPSGGLVTSCSNHALFRTCFADEGL